MWKDILLKAWAKFLKFVHIHDLIKWSQEILDKKEFRWQHLEPEVER